MPKLKRLSGKELIKILEGFGFKVISQKGSHVRLQRMIDDKEQRLTIPLQGSKEIKLGTLSGIYKQAVEFIPEDDLREHFYSD